MELLGCLTLDLRKVETAELFILDAESNKNTLPYYFFYALDVSLSTPKPACLNPKAL